MMIRKSGCNSLFSLFVALGLLQGSFVFANDGNPSAPHFEVDASWPEALPNNWIIGQVGGIAIDRHDQVWVYHRPRSLSSTAVGALGIAGAKPDGTAIDGLGNSREFGEQSSACCVPAPAVLKFDTGGKLLDSWGGPSDPGFLEQRCKTEDGCVWPAREHGIFVDHNNDVYISGNGSDAHGQFPWAATHGNDSQVLKFSSNGDFIYQIGDAGKTGPDNTAVDGGPNGTPQPFLAADMSVDPDTNLLYIADGYGNSRILIVDAETGLYVGHFGAYGQNPVIPDPADGSSWPADRLASKANPAFFRSPMHCAMVSRDGFLYACDRSNNRIQVFNIREVGKPCSNPNAEAGKCGFVAEWPIAPQTAGGTAGSAAFSSDADQSCLYVADLWNGVFYILNRKNGSELGRVGRTGRQVGQFNWLHSLAVDSAGNVYTGEVETGQRVQKFLRHGSDACQGMGASQVGQYPAG